MKKYFRFIAILLVSLQFTVMLSLWAPSVMAIQRYGHYQYAESTNATAVAGDYYGRTETLNPDAAAAFKRMVADSNCRLGVISAFRPIYVQEDLWHNQIDRRGSEEAAAKWSAPPGYSEHATGYALDIMDKDSPETELQQSFEGTCAFSWLSQHAGKYGFQMSFPPGNPQGVSYEPWHWRFVGSPAAKSVFAGKGSGAPAAPSTTTAAVPPKPVGPPPPNVSDFSFGDLKLGEGSSDPSKATNTSNPDGAKDTSNPDGAKELIEGQIPPGNVDKYEWKEGTKLSDVLTLGEIGHLSPEKMTIREVAEKTGKNPDDILMKDAHIIGLQSIGSLADTIPGLSSTPIGAIPLLSDLTQILDKAGKSYAKAWLVKNLDKPLADLFGVDPALKDYKVKDLALQEFTLGSMPGLTDTPIENFPGWEQAKISDVPGLEDLPMKDFPGGINVKPTNVFGIVDVIWGSSESQSTYSPITGSDVEGFRVPCIQDKCAYLELRDPVGDKGPLTGARWIKGGKKDNGGQMVNGGFGVLGEAFGGKEPTGRMPFGPQSNMKLVVTGVNEAEGTAQLSLYLRVEKDILGKTPFIFGPIPFMTVREGSMIPVGIDGVASLTEPNIDVPTSVLDQMKQVDLKFPGGGVGGGGITGDCTESIIKATEAGFAPSAQKYVPLILKEAEKEKLSPEELAYVLATARHESGMGKFMELMGDRGPWGKYYARGFVGLTHDYNYQKWAGILGIDLINNPDLASDPEISARILVQGMKRGEFTGYKLGDFISDQETNFFDSRAVINGVKDGAAMYAATATNYQKALKTCYLAGNCDGGSGMVTPVQGPLTSGFGYREHPLTGTVRFHSGEDFGVGEGTPILAADCGQVVFAADDGGYGNTVVIKHPNGLHTRYAHQSQILVKSGQGIGRGQPLGKVGTTGLSTGPHLHFEVRQGQPYGEPLDPRKFLG
jgi:hypothetical protein